MRIFTPVWGDKHISLLKNALGESLRWPKNNLSINDAQWIFVCETNNEAKDCKTIALRINPSIDVLIYLCPGISNTDTGVAMMYPLKEAMDLCLQDKRPMLMATPDFIFADGTIDCFKAAGSIGGGACVTIAHMRVLPGILDDLHSGLTNAQLMSLGFKYPHCSWTDCNVKSDPSRFHYGGIKWLDQGNGIKLVQHYMPSPFFVNFIEKDRESFKAIDQDRPPGFGMWDHLWPTDLLNQGRLRFIGSSDAACMLEVTDPDMNVPPFSPREDFIRNHFHNNIQKQFISIFKGN